MSRTRWNLASLRTLVLSGALLCAIVPAAILGITSSAAVRSLIVDDAIGRDSSAAVALSTQLNDTLDGWTNALASAADLAGAAPHIDQSSFGPVLATVRRHFPAFIRVEILDLSGYYIAADPLFHGRLFGGKRAGAEARRLEAIVLRTRQPLFNHEVTLAAGGVRLAGIAVPVMSPTGAARGVLIAVIDTSAIELLVLRQHDQRSGRVLVADENAHIVASQDPAILHVNRFATVRAPVWQKLNAAPSGVAHYIDSNGEDRFAGYATLPIANWKVWFSQTIPEVNRSVALAYRPGLTILLVLIVLSVVAALVLTNVIVRPIDDLRTTANAIAGGDLAVRAPAARVTDLKTLGASINRMADALAQSLESERTAKERLERSVHAYGELAGRVAAGDLSARVQVDAENDELATLGVSLNAMAQSLEHVVGEARIAAQGLVSAASEILAATSQQVSSATEGAAAVRQTTATVSEVRQTAEVAARKTRIVAELATRMADTAESGRRSIQENIRGSEEAKARMQTLASQILAFSEQAQAIAEINTTVAELAGQSNLLAVNAAIEAAKAGEASKGFGVVATEVRELGTRSKEATIQVQRIIAVIQKASQDAVIAAEQGVKSAEAGSATAQRSGEAMEVLVASISEASDAAHQIDASAAQQEAGIDQISQAMQSIEQASVQTVAAMQQVERAVADLNVLAAKLNATVGGMTRA